MDSGADAYLNSLLVNGTEDWSDRLFKQSGIGGSKSGGSTYDCTRLGQDSCGPTAKCSDYESLGAFYVHASIVNYYNAMSRLYKELTEATIYDVTAGIDKITDLIAEPDQDFQWLFTMVNALLGFGTALAGPAWQVAAPLTGLTGAVNTGAAISLATKPDPDELSDDLTKALGKIFKMLADNLNDGTKQFFTGKVEDEDKTFDGPTNSWIHAAFEDGKLLDKTRVDPSVDSLVDGIDKWLVSLYTLHGMAIDLPSGRTKPSL